VTYKYGIIFYDFRSSDDMRAGTQDRDLGEVEKEDFIDDERNGLQNGPVPDMDTLEIGITRKEVGELLNCMKYHNISFHFNSPSLLILHMA
jgi:hypothetical protein